MSKITKQLYNNLYSVKYSENKELARRMRKSNFIKTYGLFIETNGIIYGEVENSFSMSWTRNYVKVYTELALPHLELRVQNYKKKSHKMFILRLGRKDKNMPIHVDFKKRADEWVKSRSKYVIRNVLFYMKNDIEND